MTKKNKVKENESVTVIRKPLSLQEVYDDKDGSQILLDLQRENQAGLTFRVFESLGLEKRTHHH